MDLINKIQTKHTAPRKKVGKQDNETITNHSQDQINIGYKDTNFTPNGLYRFEVDTKKKRERERRVHIETETETERA